MGIIGKLSTEAFQKCQIRIRILTHCASNLKKSIF